MNSTQTMIRAPICAHRSACQSVDQPQQRKV